MTKHFGPLFIGILEYLRVITLLSWKLAYHFCMF